MAGISYGDGGTKRTITGVSYQDGATKRTIKAAWIGDGATKRQIFPSYTPITTVTISGATVVTWPTVTFDLTASSDGSATSKTYAWTKISEAGGTSFLSISGSTTSAAVHIVSSRANSSFSSDSATFRCTVSDGTSSAFKDVTVTSNGLG